MKGNDMYRIEELITIASEKGASDVHLIAGLPPKCRIDGLITNLTEETLTHEDCEEYGRQLAGEDVSEILHRGQLDLSAAIAGRRIRINLFRQQGSLSAALRLLSSSIPQLDDLGLPPAVRQFSRWNKGIVLVTGETGSGKSTTLAAILEEINRKRPLHIITLEDPIEYVYTPKRAIINQREVGTDVEDYEKGLYAALRNAGGTRDADAGGAVRRQASPEGDGEGRGAGGFRKYRGIRLGTVQRALPTDVY